MNIGAPVISEESDRFRMWYAIEDNGLWDIAYAESIDGEYWEDFGSLSIRLSIVIPLPKF